MKKSAQIIEQLPGHSGRLDHFWVYDLGQDVQIRDLFDRCVGEYRELVLFYPLSYRRARTLPGELAFKIVVHDGAEGIGALQRPILLGILFNLRRVDALLDECGPISRLGARGLQTDRVHFGDLAPGLVSRAGEPGLKDIGLDAPVGDADAETRREAIHDLIPLALRCGLERLDLPIC